MAIAFRSRFCSPPCCCRLATTAPSARRKRTRPPPIPRRPPLGAAGLPRARRAPATSPAGRPTRPARPQRPRRPVVDRAGPRRAAAARARRGYRGRFRHHLRRGGIAQRLVPDRQCPPLDPGRPRALDPASGWISGRYLTFQLQTDKAFAAPDPPSPTVLTSWRDNGTLTQFNYRNPTECRGEWVRLTVVGPRRHRAPGLGARHLRHPGNHLRRRPRRPHRRERAARLDRDELSPRGGRAISSSQPHRTGDAAAHQRPVAVPRRVVRARSCASNRSACGSARSTPISLVSIQLRAMAMRGWIGCRQRLVAEPQLRGDQRRADDAADRAAYLDVAGVGRAAVEPAGREGRRRREHRRARRRARFIGPAYRGLAEPWIAA